MSQPIYDGVSEATVNLLEAKRLGLPLTEDQQAKQNRRATYLSEQRKVAADHMLAAFTLIEQVETAFASGAYDDMDIFDVPKLDAYLDAVAVVEASGAPMPPHRKMILLDIQRRSSALLEQKLGV